LAVYLNDRIIQAHTPTDYHVGHGKFVFVVSKEYPETDLTFFG
jgi:hypothetical protein